MNQVHIPIFTETGEVTVKVARSRDLSTPTEAELAFLRRFLGHSLRGKAR